MLFYGRHRTALLNRQRDQEQPSWAGNTDKPWASRAPADRGRGFVPPWTTTDGCRRAKRINSTGDPCLHHLHLFLEALHLFFRLLSSLCILSVVSSANCCRRCSIFAPPPSIIVNWIKNLAYNWACYVLCELCRCRANTDCCIAELNNHMEGWQSAGFHFKQQVLPLISSSSLTLWLKLF